MKRTASVFRSSLPWLAVLAAIAAVVLGVKVRPNAANAAGKTQAVAGQAGMRAFIDPETGQVGVPSELPPTTPEEAAQIQGGPASEQIKLPDGSYMVELNGEGQEYMVMQLTPDGKRAVRCVEDPKTALKTPPSTTGREVK